MPEAKGLSGDRASPAQLAWRQLWRRPGARWSMRVLAVLVAIAIYAPFLAGEAAWLWWDETGLHLPVLQDLFNRATYRERHDLLFNLAGLLLPPLILLAWLSRRFLSFRLRLALPPLLIGLAWILAQLPLLPGSDGGRWRALWDDRPLTPHTSVARAGLERIEAKGVLAGLRGGEQLLAEDLGLVKALYAQAATGLVTVATADGVHHELPAEALRAPQRHLVLLPPVPHGFHQPYQGAVLQRPGAVNAATGATFWLGTDPVGRDVMARMVFGARISLTVGLLATSIALAIGVVIGATSGYFGGRIDLVLQRIVEIMMCFPAFLLILFVVAVVGKSIFIIALVQGLVGWAGTARLVRGEFLAQAGREYVVAVEALGLPRWRIMFRHILPNAMTPLLIGASFGIAGAVLGEAGLAFLGLVEPRTPSWGLILNAGRDKIEYAHLIYAPGLAIFALVYSLNTLGNALREVLDPKEAQQ